MPNEFLDTPATTFASHCQPAAKRLTLARCRQMLGEDSPETDADVERAREQLTALAAVVVTAYLERKAGGGDVQLCAFEEEEESPSPGDFQTALALIADDDRDGVEERAAIMEFDGGLERSEVERTAVCTSVVDRHVRKGKWLQ